MAALVKDSDQPCRKRCAVVQNAIRTFDGLDFSSEALLEFGKSGMVLLWNSRSSQV